MKILLLDIETAPNLAYVWGLWKENIPTARIVNNGYVMCWAAKWLGEPAGKTRFASIMGGTKEMLAGVRALLCEADAVVHYYGSSFDIPTLNKEFVTHGMLPPSPYKQIDLCTVVRQTFKFPSSKLDYVAKTLGLGSKLRHPGFELWIDCMAKDPKAWRLMERYNRQDVLLTERLYTRLLPWIEKHPNRATQLGVKACPSCGSEDIKKSGWAFTEQMKYQRYSCNDCGKWFRGNVSEKRNAPADRVTQIRS